MNEARRKEISKAISLLEEALPLIDSCATEEREAYDALPDSIKESDKGEFMDGAATTLEEADDTIRELVENLTSAKE